MKRITALVCAALMTLALMLPCGALADQLYFLDTDTREITESELWGWDRESLSFLFNEIFARHGFTFDAGGKFYNWFNMQPWYQSIAKVDDQTAYNRTTKLEWKNYETIRRVIRQMEAVGWPYRRSGQSTLKSWIDFQPPGNWSLTGFRYVNVRSDKNLAVYSAPGKNAWRGANGKAQMSTNGAVWAAGWDSGWLLVFYEVNKGGLRVGYVNGSELRDRGDVWEQLMFSRTPVRVTAGCTLTDDPLQQVNDIAYLQPGATVTYLTTMTNQNGYIWDYVETTVNGKQARGFVPSGCLDISWNDEPEEGAYGLK